MKLYMGETTASGEVVDVADDEDAVLIARPLRTRRDLRNHSPDGFSWGYNGSGPAQLALAILCDFFKALVIANIPFDTEIWTLTGSQVEAAIAELRRPS